MRKIIFLLSIIALNFSHITVIDAQEIQENSTVRFGVMKFLSRAEGVTDKQAEAIGDIFARMLANSESIIVVERDRFEDLAKEHQFAKSGRFEDDEVIELGKLISCKYILLGAVTNLIRKTSTTNLWIVSETLQEVTATIDLRVVDVETSKVIYTLSENGSSSEKGSGFNIYGFQLNKNKDFTGLEILAISEATAKSVFKIREEFANEYVQVTNITSTEITINAGENWGLTPGMFLQIYSEGGNLPNLGNIEGISTAKKRNLLAIVKISDVQKDFCVAQILKNGGRASSLRKGNKVQPIDSKEAEKLIKQKFFSNSKGENSKKK